MNMHPSFELFLVGLIFGAGFHIAGAVIGFVGEMLVKAGNRRTGT